MINLKKLLPKRKAARDRKAIQDALALHRRGEVRRDGLDLISAAHHLEIEWRARDIHPWDRFAEPGKREALFAEHSIVDTEAALSRLFNELPEVEVIEFRVIRPGSGQRILAGTVERAATASSPCVSASTKLWQKGVAITIVAIMAFVLSSGASGAQSQTATANPVTESSVRPLTSLS